MIPLIDDGFNVSNYLKDSQPTNSVKTPDPDNNPEINQRALDWSRDSMNVIIHQADNISDLDRQWIEFNNTTKKHRRESDWKSIELYGMTNQDHYEKLRRELTGEDTNLSDEGLNESYIPFDVADSVFDPGSINYSDADVEAAKEWMKVNNKIIIVPVSTIEELDELWDSFNLMIKKHRRESDWKSEELFGVSNLRHYEYLKNDFLKKRDKHFSPDSEKQSLIEANTYKFKKSYIDKVYEEEPITEFINSVLSMKLSNKNNVREDAISSSIVYGLVNNDTEVVASNPETIFSYGDMPFYTPDIMIDKGVGNANPEDNFFGVEPSETMLNEDISIKEWFEMYKAEFNGFNTEYGNYVSDWVNKVRTVSYQLETHIANYGDENKSLRMKQTLLELGWNPDVKFNYYTRKLVSELYNIKNRHSSTFYDLRGFNSNERMALSEGDIEYNIKKSEGIHPVYVVLSDGKTFISNAIKGFTHSNYSHASLSFDAKLDHMYSFGIKDKDNGIAGGFEVESINEDPNSVISVFVFFVNDVMYDKLQIFVNDMLENKENLKYGYTNLIKYLFNIPSKKFTNKMVCSQFVDNCIKIACPGMTTKDSSLTSPEDLNTTLKGKKNIYHVYDGLARKYNGKKTTDLVYKIMDKHNTGYYSENVSFYESQTEYLVRLMNNIHNIYALREMSGYLGIVESEDMKKLIQKKLFDGLNAELYEDLTEPEVKLKDSDSELLNDFRSIDYMDIFKRCKDSLIENTSRKNTDGMKYELAKLSMLSKVLMNSIVILKSKDPSDSKISSYENIKISVIETYRAYMAKLLELEPGFNFKEYYKTTQFSSITDKDTKLLSDINRSILSTIPSI